jgi:hypothetical protein
VKKSVLGKNKGMEKRELGVLERSPGRTGEVPVSTDSIDRTPAQENGKTDGGRKEGPASGMDMVTLHAKFGPEIRGLRASISTYLEDLNPGSITDLKKSIDDTFRPAFSKETDFGELDKILREGVRNIFLGQKPGRELPKNAQAVCDAGLRMLDNLGARALYGVMQSVLREQPLAVATR